MALTGSIKNAILLKVMVLEVVIPENIVQAKNYLKKNFCPLAGGTTLLLNRPKDGKFLDLSHLNLDYIKYQKKSLRVGAMVTIARLLEEKKLQKLFGGLIPQALLTIGSTLNRNMITVGGNCVGIRIWSVLPGLFLLLDARMNTIQKKSYPARKFFSTLPKNLLKNDIVTEVEIPLDYKSYSGCWLKFSLTRTDYPLVSVGSLKTPKSIRLVAIGLTLLPQLWEISKENVPAKLDEIVQKAKISQDIRVSPEYKREILKTLLLDVVKCKNY